MGDAVTRLDLLSPRAMERLFAESGVGMTREEAARLAGPEPIRDDWRPAPGERCCGTCTHLREHQERGLSCVLEPDRFLGARWWGTACAMWTGERSIPVALPTTEAP